MPLIINELIIKANVSDAPGANTAGAGNTANASGNNNDRQAIIAACVEQVLEILEKKKER